MGALGAKSHLQLVLNASLGLLMVRVIVEVYRSGKLLRKLELEGHLIVTRLQRLSLGGLREVIARLFHMDDVAVRLTEYLDPLSGGVFPTTVSVILDIGELPLLVAFELELKVGGARHRLHNTHVDRARDGVVRIVELLIGLQLHITVVK